MKISQPCLNAARSLLNQEGYCKDFGDFYEAGKALSEWPKSRFLPPQHSPAEMEEMAAIVVEFEPTPESVTVLKKAIKHYIESKKQPTEYHFELFRVLELNPKSSLT